MRRNNLARSVTGDSTEALAAWRALPRPERVRIQRWAAWIAVSTLAFAQPLLQLLRHASESTLNSHIPLVPLVAGYLLFIQRKALPAAGPGAIALTLLMGVISIASLAVRFEFGNRVSFNDGLALLALAYVSLVAAGGFLFLGVRWMIAAAFPLAFLIFMVPLPDAAVSWLEMASVAGSAEVAAAFFKATGTPLLRDGMVFTLPTIVLEVARECSGIRSSWVLFITSLVASHMFLKNPWRRIILVTFVIPLGIVRNGFRILVIGLLCVHIGPHMIDSVIHHRGGPIFFALSLVPLFLLVVWLRRTDRPV